MGKIERGEHIPSISIVMRVALALDISSTVLMEEMERLLEQNNGGR